MDVDVRLNGRHAQGRILSALRQSTVSRRLLELLGYPAPGTTFLATVDCLDHSAQLELSVIDTPWHAVVLGHDWESVTGLSSAIIGLTRIAANATNLMSSRSTGPLPAGCVSEACASEACIFEAVELIAWLLADRGFEHSEFIVHSLERHTFTQCSVIPSASRMYILSHLLTGACVDSKCVPLLETGGALTKASMSLKIISILVSKALTTLQLHDLLCALGLILLDEPTYFTPILRTALDRLVSLYCRRWLPPSDDISHEYLLTFFNSLERHRPEVLENFLASHGIVVSPATTADSMRSLLVSHFSAGDCALHEWATCVKTRSLWLYFLGVDPESTASLSIPIRIVFLDWACRYIRSYIPLSRLMRVTTGISPVNIPETLEDCQQAIRPFIERLAISIPYLQRFLRLTASGNHDIQLSEIRRKWPELLSEDAKFDIIDAYRAATGPDALSTFVCASCSGRTFCSKRKSTNINDFPSALFRVSESLLSKNPVLSIPHFSGHLDGCLLDRAGVVFDARDLPIRVNLCIACSSSATNGRLPALALANGLYLGPIPDELQGLTLVEEILVARCRAKAWIVHLREEKRRTDKPTTQRGLKGHVIVFPQSVTEIAAILPPPVESIENYLCVMFIGSSKPTREWLQSRAKPLLVRREKVRKALQWLTMHNPLYSDVVLDHDQLDRMPADEFMPPIHIEHVMESVYTDIQTARYDLPDDAVGASALDVFPSVVVTDVDALAPAYELRAAALRHVKQRGGGYIQVPHGPLPINEFNNPDLLPMIYPTLFPYGIGGPEDSSRSVTVSFQRHIKHLLHLSDRRFQEHYSFIFTTFNIIQRRKALLHTSLRVKKNDFERIATAFASVTPEILAQVAAEMSKKSSFTPKTEDERNAALLMRHVKSVTAAVPGSSASRSNLRNELRALVIEKGLPTYYLTINPADVYNPIVRFLGGEDLTVDEFISNEASDYWSQATLVAHNPFVAAQFFNIIMHAFIKTVLNYNPVHGINVHAGTLGIVKAFYGCVEAQGRGSLHCHGVVWLEGGLNPDQIRHRISVQGDVDFRDRLLKTLDDTISNHIPPDPGPTVIVPSSSKHPSSVIGVFKKDYASESAYRTAMLKDLHNLATQSQYHMHTFTCYKYCTKDQPQLCRFGLGEGDTCERSWYNYETGEIHLKRSEVDINNYNSTSLLTTRCNSDLKFILSGRDAKGIFEYIAEYITKSQLSAYVAYAALEKGVKKLGDDYGDENTVMFRGKRMLQKCAYSMLSHQELSAQQVVSYLCDFEDHFTTHAFRNLYWHTFEQMIEKQLPSPDCCPGRYHLSDVHASDATVDSSGDADRDEDEQTSDYDGDEVNIDIQSGDFVAKTPQVLNYQMRGIELDNMSLWEYTSRVDKVRIAKHMPFAMAGARSDNLNMDTMDHTEGPSFADIPHPLPRYIRFLADHPDYTTHCSAVRSVASAFVPVPIPVAVPRRDRDETRSRHARLMLILFKPWRKVSDLRGPFASWSNSFEAFIHISEPAIKERIDNLQVLHECKDSRDDHFEKLRKRQISDYTSIRNAAPNYVNDDFVGEDNLEELILDHLSSIDASTINNKMATQRNALECLKHAQECGLFGPYISNSINSVQCTNISCTHESCLNFASMALDGSLEDAWRQAYQKRRENWKQQAAMQFEVEGFRVLPSQATVSSGDDFRSTIVDQQVNANIHYLEATHEHVATELSPHNVINSIINVYTLNEAQSLAFRIIAEHSLGSSCKPLRMYLGGEGGTGKSRVIQALKSFFAAQNQLRRLQITAFTGIAALNIEGMTLHSALSLHHKKQHSEVARVGDLSATWDGVDYLFIDEVSMIGCSFLVDIHHALIKAKGKSEPFGGLNVIFAGDFHQLAPVGERRLFTNFDGISKINPSPKIKKDMEGQVLWHSITTVVILTELMRQTGSLCEPFIHLLGRLRHGACTDADFDMLNSRLASLVQPDWNEWLGAPIIVNDNHTKDALNEEAAIAFANREHKHLHWYYATDMHRGEMIENTALRENLLARPSGQTDNKLGCIPLCLGMPVMITQNYDVPGGIVNGSIGTLSSIRYATTVSGKREALSCAVKLSNMTAPNLPHLQPQEAAVLRTSVDLRFDHRFSGKKCSIKRSQLPIVPAFAMTVHKAQGQTLDKVIIDLSSCRGFEAPYVMISRVRSLDGLIILKPFDRSKISCHPSEELRTELKRLHILKLETAAQFGTLAAATLAQEELLELHSKSQSHDSTMSTGSLRQYCTPTMSTDAGAEGLANAYTLRAPKKRRLM